MEINTAGNDRVSKQEFFDYIKKYYRQTGKLIVMPD